MEPPINLENIKKDTCTESKGVEAFRQRMLDHIKIEGVINTIISEEYCDSELIIKIEEMTRMIAQSEGGIVTIKKQNARQNNFYIEPHKFVNNIMLIYKYDIDGLLRRCYSQSKNPYFDVFIRNTQACKELFDAVRFKLRINPMNCREFEDVNKDLESIHEVIEKIRHETSTNEFKIKIKNFQRNPNKVLMGLRGYVNRLFENYSSLCIVRIKLFINEHIYTNSELYRVETSPKCLVKDAEKFFQEKSKVPIERLDEFLHDKSMESIENINELILKESKESVKYIDKFIHGMASKKSLENVFDDCVGYIIKRERGFQRGFYFNAIIIFNGSKVQDDCLYATKVGDCWKSITEGVGSYFNCSLSNCECINCGVGHAHHDEIEKRKRIDNALIYMVKPDDYMRLAISDKVRNLRRGEMPPANNQQQGRERRKCRINDHK